jgi:hypothetical protein
MLLLPQYPTVFSNSVKHIPYFPAASGGALPQIKLSPPFVSTKLVIPRKIGHFFIFFRTPFFLWNVFRKKQTFSS